MAHEINYPYLHAPPDAMSIDKKNTELTKTNGINSLRRPAHELYVPMAEPVPEHKYTNKM